MRGLQALLVDGKEDLLIYPQRRQWDQQKLQQLLLASLPGTKQKLAHPE